MTTVSQDLLTTRLLDLLYELRDEPPIIGGGLGLYHKQRYRQGQGMNLLFADMPPARATRDIDAFLRAEVIANAAAAERVKAVLTKLEYRAVPGKELWQWRHGELAEEVVVDLLVGPLGSHRDHVLIKAHRVKPHRTSGLLHAYATHEAAGLEPNALRIPILGVKSNGQPWQTELLVPHAFTYLIMKLHALHDRIERADSDYGRHHALDLFRIVAMLDSAEYEEALILRGDLTSEEGVQRARSLVHALFKDDESPGCLRLREHPLFRGFDAMLPKFLDVLAEIHPPPVTHTPA